MLESFLNLVASEPDATASIEEGLVVSRGALLERSEALADELRTVGLRAGDTIAVQLPNSAEFVATFVAALKLDLVFTPIDRDATGTEVASILAHFGIRGLVRRSGPALVSTRPAERPAALPAGARLLKLTSGSTGRPKAIVCSEANLLADCANICGTMGIGPGDVNLGAIPFSHSYGFSNLVTPLLVQGTAVVISNEYLPLSILGLANHHRCTVAPLIPMVFEHLASLPREDGEFETVRTFISAGAPLMASTSRRFRERYGTPIHTFYGCSETGGITYDRLGAAVERGSVGGAMEGVELGIDPASRRLEIRSASVALGTFPDGASFCPFGGTFTADDLVELDSAGEIVLLGRASDLINTAGKKVDPREVEQIILQIDGVREVKVYGEPAGARGEVVAAAVVASPDVTREQVREFCRGRLSSHKVPRIVKMIEQIPLDERGKVRRAALSEL